MLRQFQWSSAPVAGLQVSGREDLPGQIILVHGLGDTAGIWRPLMEHWRPPVTTIAMDLPGHGGSPRLDHGYSITALSDHLADALACNGISRPLLIGHSLGARLCASVAARPGSTVFGVVLIDMGLSGDEAIGAAVADHIDAVTTGAQTLDGLIQLVTDRLPLSDPAAVRIALAGMAVCLNDRWHVPLDLGIKKLLQGFTENDVITMLDRISVPVALIRGAYSAVMTKTAAGQMAASLRPFAMVHTIEQAGHAIPLEQPAQLSRVLDICFASMTRAPPGYDSPDIAQDQS